LIDRPDASLPRQPFPILFKKIAAIIGLSLLLLAVGLLLVNIMWYRDFSGMSDRPRAGSTGG
jgi:hypothetical protein